MRKFNNRPNNSHEVDGKIIWVSRSVALVGVIIAKNKNEDYVLIGKRGSGSADYQGLWNVPCGYLDWDENGHEGIYREIYEETGLYIPDIIENKYIIDNHMKQPFFVGTNIDENRQNVSLSYGLYFECEELPYLTNEHSEEDEVSEVKWIKISEINGYKFAFNHDIRIKNYHERL